jgi:hypothetical protein
MRWPITADITANKSLPDLFTDYNDNMQDELLQVESNHAICLMAGVNVLQ